MAEITTLTALPHWRAVDFISDLHLCEALPLTFEALVEHLTCTDADAVLILGDLFEVWVGDDQRHRPFEQAFVSALRAQASHRWLGFMVGNRDFLVGADLCKAAGLHRLDDPTCLHAFGSRWLLTHGDALCLEDVEYQAFRRMVRGDDWQARFLEQPFEARWAVAGRIREESRSRKSAAADPSLWADVDPQAAQAWLAQADAHTLIHGHTHRPGDETWGEGAARSVLSDWDLDHLPLRAQLLRLDANGLSRREPASRSGTPRNASPTAGLP